MCVLYSLKRNNYYKVTLAGMINSYYFCSVLGVL